jgi:hypothetical protein
MKSKEEIEQLAEKHYTQITLSQRTAFKLGYTQCQEDMADKKYTEDDLKKAMNYASQITNNKMKYIEDYINSLNKQD